MARVIKGRRRSERIGDLLTAWVRWLPPRLQRFLPRELVCFCLLGAFTFAVDLVLLTLLRRTTDLPIPVAVSVAYLLAFGLNFVLNRTVNFRSHAPVGRQAVRYGAVILCDYLITVGVTTGLSAAGLDFRVARVLASLCVAAFTYTASRFWVFRDPPAPVSPEAPVMSRTG